MNFYAHNQNNALFQILYKHTLKQEEINIKFLGVETDKNMVQKMHIKLILQKLSNPWYAIRCMKNSSNIENCRIMYPAMEREFSQKHNLFLERWYILMNETTCFGLHWPSLCF